MKKVFLILVAVIGLGFVAKAQSNNLGVRLGGGQGYNAEISWQHALSANRVEMDFGWANYSGTSAFSLTGIYQWTFELPNNFGWFVGPGAYIGMATYDGNSSVALALAGQVGAEYNFEAVPLQLSLDIRPRFYVVPSTNFHWGDLALGIRYRF